MLNDILPLILFPLMLILSGYVLSEKETHKARFMDSIHWSIFIWHMGLLIMVIHHIETTNFVVFYPIILAVYIRLMLSDKKVKTFNRGFVKLAVTIIAFCNALISEEWALAISIAIAYLALLIYYRYDKTKNI